MKHVNTTATLTACRRLMLVRLCAAVLVLAVALPAGAQNGLGVAEVFRLYGHSHGSNMVEMNDAMLKGYRLKTYKSLVYKKNQDRIEAILDSDRKQAKKIREVVEDGQVVSGYYMMTPSVKGMNRYILFSRYRKGRGTVIYIEGRLSPDDIMKMCYTRK